ncbi:MAG TPA: plastocyanin/azurin family copper-binding protein [Solirubrobacteraceae bacterium]|nr:plastocyanin/azurin family copper-binding protein [Solirubrobacteraceae bacterium]
MIRRAYRAATVTAVLLATAGATAAPATAGDAAVTIGFAAFNPWQVDVLPGETVVWSNGGGRTHTVTADDGSFGSGEISNGGRFSLRFSTPGMYMYHCQIHPGMTGEVDVRRLILNPVPSAGVLKGRSLTVSGRSADGQAPVQVQQSAPSGYRTIATTTPAPDGTWSVAVRPAATANLRAVSGADTSQVRRLRVVDRGLHVRVTGRDVLVTATPPDPGAIVVLERKLRERFGWWPTQRRRLDYLSRARFHVRGPARVRVELVDTDGWTPLVVSRPLRISRRPGRR